MIIKNRNYIHGDQSELDNSVFYCSSCDVFFSKEHFFSNEDKCCDHWKKYDAAMKMLGNSKKKHHDFGREINSPNVFKL